jgi:redox-sensitive bicupin YhaK (pirin superfamily)
MLRSYRLGSTGSNNATPLKWGKAAGDQARHELGEGRGGYLYVLDGELRLGDERLGGGDAAKLAGPGELEVAGVDDAELILIEVPLRFRPIGVWAS